MASPRALNSLPAIWAVHMCNTQCTAPYAHYFGRPWGSVLGPLGSILVSFGKQRYTVYCSLILIIVIVFDISEKIDDFLRSNVSVDKIIFDYYLNFIPYFGNLFSPLFIFISVLITGLISVFCLLLIFIFLNLLFILNVIKTPLKTVL